MTGHEIPVHQDERPGQREHPGQRERPGQPARPGQQGRSAQHEPPGEPARRERLLTPEIVTLSAVVVLGSIMTILDATIVNVALPTLGREFHTSITTIQWVPTVYLLAFASVIPLTGWASERFGTKLVWLVSLSTFMLGSLLAGLSWSIGVLI